MHQVSYCMTPFSILQEKMKRFGEPDPAELRQRQSDVVGVLSVKDIEVGCMSEEIGESREGLCQIEPCQLLRNYETLLVLLQHTITITQLSR